MRRAKQAISVSDQELAAQRVEESARQLEALSWRESVARLLLSAILVVFGLYMLANYLRALVWALVLAIALWPLYDRVRQKTSPWAAKEILPIAFTILVGLAVFLPVAVLAVDAVREVRDLIDFARSAEESGIPVPEFAVRLPGETQAEKTARREYDAERWDGPTRSSDERP
jgi:predicted PurR-regulated permease PerM